MTQNQTKQKPTFVMFDGIDGSGKSTVLQTFVRTLVDHGSLLFDLTEWSKGHHRLPSVHECHPANLLVSAEPTHAWIGRAVREEMIRSSTSYPPRAIAEAFALDRLVLYERLLIPLRRAGVTIVQDRGVSTSIVYQAGSQTGLSLEEICALHGNALALKHAPDLLVITDCDPEVALARLAERADKHDDSHFEQLQLLKIHAERFRAPWFEDLWRSCGTEVVYLDANKSIAEVRAACKALARTIMQLA